MKFHYYPETDSLYIEISSGIVIDYDQGGQPIGIDIDNASKVVDLTRLEAEALPLKALAII
jgi:uncharacterized protein YuzE